MTNQITHYKKVEACEVECECGRKHLFELPLDQCFFVCMKCGSSIWVEGEDNNE